MMSARFQRPSRSRPSSRIREPSIYFLTILANSQYTALPVPLPHTPKYDIVWVTSFSDCRKLAMVSVTSASFANCPSCAVAPDRRGHCLHLLLVFLISLLADAASREPRPSAAVSVETAVRLGLRDLLERGDRDLCGGQQDRC